MDCVGSYAHIMDCCAAITLGSKIVAFVRVVAVFFETASYAALRVGPRYHYVWNMSFETLTEPTVERTS